MADEPFRKVQSGMGEASVNKVMACLNKDGYVAVGKEPIFQDGKQTGWVIKAKKNQPMGERPDLKLI